MKAVELFTGAGGLGMGLSLAGFKPQAVVEWDRFACDTIRQNQARQFSLVRDWPLHEADVRDWTQGACRDIGQDIDLVAGGPPCQPFSMGGKHRAHGDQRDMFPATVDVIRHLQPRAFIIENVKGLTRPTFHDYYHYILFQLEFPDVSKKVDESWPDHYGRLQRVKSSKSRAHAGLTYNVVPKLVNAANYGVPQRRERVFIVGFRADLGIEWEVPRETHSLDALLFGQFVTGAYWDRHAVPVKMRPQPPAVYQSATARMHGLRLLPTKQAWRTVKDALTGLSDPELHEHQAMQHTLQTGARAYAGHTGSPLHWPAKTLKAGDHGVPGGENMLVKDDGAVRYFTVRESARLQTFPDAYLFHGSWTESMRQLGNAVPVALGHVIAASVAERIIETRLQDIAARAMWATA